MRAGEDPKGGKHLEYSDFVIFSSDLRTPFKEAVNDSNQRSNCFWGASATISISCGENMYGEIMSYTALRLRLASGFRPVGMSPP